MFDKAAHKIIFTGPVGAGKTTAITAISDTPPISTEQVATDHTKDKKQMTTVALDYGMMRLDNGEVIHLYGTPGQQRFNFMWEILTEGAIGVVILVDSAEEKPLDDLRFFLQNFIDFIRDQAVVVGITRMDIGQKHTLDEYYAVLKQFDLNPALFEVDARKQRDVILLIQALLFTLDPGVAA